MSYSSITKKKIKKNLVINFIVDNKSIRLCSSTQRKDFIVKCFSTIHFSVSFMAFELWLIDQVIFKANMPKTH